MSKNATIANLTVTKQIKAAFKMLIKAEKDFLLEIIQIASNLANHSAYRSIIISKMASCSHSFIRQFKYVV